MCHLVTVCTTALKTVTYFQAQVDGGKLCETEAKAIEIWGSHSDVDEHTSLLEY